LTFVALVALAVLAGRGGGIELEQEREKRGPDDEGWERRPTSESPYPEVRALTDDQRDAMETEMGTLQKQPAARLRYTVKLGEEADRKLHRLAPQGDVTYNRLWKDLRPPCRKRTLVHRHLEKVGGVSQDYYEDAGTGITLPGDEQTSCYDDAASEKEDMGDASQPPASSGALNEDDVMDGAYTSHLKDGVPYTRVPSREELVSPLDPYVRHARLDAMTAQERSKIGQDDANEHNFFRELDKVKQLKDMVAAREAQIAKENAKGALWAGVDTDLTAEDLRPRTKEEQKLENITWTRWDMMNNLMAKQNTDADKLKAARETEASDQDELNRERRQDPGRMYPREAGDHPRYTRGRQPPSERKAMRDLRRGEDSPVDNSRDQDQANQKEIHSNDLASSWLWWERDQTLHYKDLGPDGKDTIPLKYAFRYTSKPVAPPPPPPPPPPPGVPPPPSPLEMEASKKPGWCVFCQTADQYLKHTSKETVKESKDADPEKPFTPQDWKDGQGDADFEKSFPDTNDLRVIDWLAAGDEAEGPYDAHKDSMSSVGAGPFKDYPPDFVPKAKGYYTNWGSDGAVPGSGWAGLYGGKYLKDYVPPEDKTKVVYQSPRLKQQALRPAHDGAASVVEVKRRLVRRAAR